LFVNERKEVIRNIKFLLIVSIFFVLLIPQGVSAHAVLEKAIPGPDSRLQNSPKEIVLMFNERLENKLYSIKVFNNRGEEISKKDTEQTVDQKQLKQVLPKLANGTYTISYRAISADGHPIKGSYLITIGGGSGENVSRQQESIEDQVSPMTTAVRIIYYILLLLVTGWVLWGTAASEEIRSSFKRFAHFLLVVFILVHVGMGYIQAAGLIDHWEWNKVLSLLTGTTVGLAWGISMILSLLGFALLLRNPWLDKGWVFLMLVPECVNGHAFAFKPLYLTVSLDFIHLLAAAMWAGGLLFILIYWQKQRKHVRHFLEIFSKAAFISMLVLIVTGSAITVIYLPELDYLFFSNWGTFLLIKIILVLFVIVIGGLLRRYLMNKHDGKVKSLIKADFSLMIAIICIVGIFTYISPLPENKPLYWHKNEKNIEFTATISPKVPGNNIFMVDAKTNQEGVNIKRIELFLHYKDNSEVAPIRVPFADYKQAKKVHYMIDGQYLPFPGNWRAEIRILDSEENEKVFTKDFIVY
jgi:copper transport protein